MSSLKKEKKNCSFTPANINLKVTLEQIPPMPKTVKVIKKRKASRGAEKAAELTSFEYTEKLEACKLEKVTRLHVSITKQEARLLRLKNQIPSTSSTLVTIKKNKLPHH
jgi:hypothetical protein